MKTTAMFTTLLALAAAFACAVASPVDSKRDSAEGAYGKRQGNPDW